MHRRRIIALALAVALAVLGVTAWMAGGAQATTGTCLNIATPISAPIGCGGLYFSGLGSGIQPDGTSLTLTATNPQWNSRVTDTFYDASRSDQDWTVYQRCSTVSGVRSVASPCGTGGSAFLDPDGQAEFVAEATPLGHHLDASGLINKPGNLCLSVEAVANGPLVHHHHALRWRTVLRTCDSLGATFFAGIPNGGADAGTTGVVTSPNFWQTWSPFGPVGSGFVFANNALSGNVFNHKFVLDAPGGSHVPGQWLLAYPENDQPNQVARIIGCTGRAEPDHARSLRLPVRRRITHERSGQGPLHRKLLTAVGHRRHYADSPVHPRL